MNKNQDCLCEKEYNDNNDSDSLGKVTE